MKTSLTLDELLDGAAEPPSEAPLHVHERPAYRRDGLYGSTPFKARVERIVALTTEQQCLNCGAVHMGFGGLYREFEGQGLMGTLSLRNEVKGPVTKDAINRVQHDRTEVPFCPSCLEASCKQSN